MEEKTRKTMVKVILGILLVSMLATGAFLAAAFASQGEGKSQTSTAQISETQARSIAQGVASGTISKVEREDENGKIIYSVEFTEGSVETNVEVDAQTGAIVRVEQEDENGFHALEVVNPAVSEADAKAIALASIPGTVTDMETKKVNGVYVYEFEIQSNGKESDVLVDMMSGAIVGIETEAIEKDDDEEGADEDELSQKEIATLTIGVSEEQAIQIAKGLVSGEITDVEFERKLGHDVYSVEITESGEETDVFVDIKTGEVIGTESDSEEGDEEEDDE